MAEKLAGKRSPNVKVTAPSSANLPSTPSAAEIVNLQAAVRSAVLGFVSTASSFSEMSSVLSSNCRNAFCGGRKTRTRGEAGFRDAPPERRTEPPGHRHVCRQNGDMHGHNRRETRGARPVRACGVDVAGHALSRLGRSSKCAGRVGGLAEQGQDRRLGLQRDEALEMKPCEERGRR